MALAFSSFMVVHYVCGHGMIPVVSGFPLWNTILIKIVCYNIIVLA